MNYNEGEVAFYPPTSEFDLGFGTCFMTDDFSLNLDSSTTLLAPTTSEPESEPLPLHHSTTLVTPEETLPVLSESEESIVISREESPRESLSEPETLLVEEKSEESTQPIAPLVVETIEIQEPISQPPQVQAIRSLLNQQIFCQQQQTVSPVSKRTRTQPLAPVQARPPVAVQQPISSTNRPLTATRVNSRPILITPQPAPQVPCYPPTIAFPFVPFWTGCPLPFDPRSYPQPVVPQSPLMAELATTGNKLPAMTSKEEKIAKYRLKRSKRNFNRPVDTQRSQIAEKRPRDEKGKFQERERVVVDVTASPSLGKRVERSLRAQVDELKERLALSESESRALKEKLSYMEQELRLLKLTQQQKSCLEDDDNEFQKTGEKKMSTSPPYMFSSTNQSMVDCYTAKIDFSQIELRKTDSPHLEGLKKLSPPNPTNPIVIN